MFRALPSNPQIALAGRVGVADGPFNSSELIFLVQGATAAAFDLDTWVYGPGNLGLTIANRMIVGRPFLAGAMTIAAPAAIPANVTRLTARLDLVKAPTNQAGGVVIASSVTVDLRAATPESTFQLAASVPLSGNLIVGDRIAMRLNISAASSGAFAGVDLAFPVGEPTFAFTPTADPFAFTPPLGRWVPNFLDGQHNAQTDAIIQSGQTGNPAWMVSAFQSSVIESTTRVAFSRKAYSPGNMHRIP